MGLITTGPKFGMILLDANTSKTYFGLLITGCLAANLGLSVLCQVEENLAIQHTVFV